MYKNLLFALFAILFGVTTGMADNVMIDVDKAANVEVTYGYDNTVLRLDDGMNRITTLTAADSPITIRPALGAQIVSITKNQTEELQPSGDGAYRVAVEAMMLQIVTSGGSADIPNYNTFFSVIGEMGKFTANYDDESVLIDEAKYYELPAVPITLKPIEGYQITEVDYNPTWMANEAVNNGDGTWTFTPAWDGTNVNVTVIEKGVMFTVEVNLPTNITVVAWTTDFPDWEQEGTFKELTLNGYGPYIAVAPIDAKVVDFYPQEGCIINSVTRVQANGETTQLDFGAYTGAWRSRLAEGDTFTVNCEGPEVELSLISSTEGIDVDRYVVSVNGEVASFTKDNPVVKARAGNMITVGGGRGTKVTTIYPDNCGTQIYAYGPVASFMVTKSGNLYIYGTDVTDMTIDIDNAKAVVITDQNGLGKVLDLVNGDNVLTDVANPINIVAAQGFMIKSVVLDGEVLKPIADGSYKAAIESGSTLVITTAVKPAAYPVTIALTGEFEWLNVAVDGEPVTVGFTNSTLAVEPGSEITFSAVKGYLINSLTTSTNVLFAVYDDDADEWTVTVNGPGSVMIDMQKWVAGENAVLIDYTVNDQNIVSATVRNAKGEWVSRLAPGLNEVEKGMFLSFTLSEINDATFSEVLYNGVAQNISENGKACSFEVNEEGTVSVTAVVEFYVDVTGYSTSNPVNHAIIGNIFINEEGERHFKAKPGEQITILPTPGPGYIFDGFSKVIPAWCADLISPEPPYVMTVPEGLEYIILEGNFIPDEEHPSYVVHTYLCYVDGLAPEDMSASAFVRLSTNPYMADWEVTADNTTNDVLIAEGDQVKFFCFVATEDMKCVNFCLFTQPEVVIPQVYTVNGEHANVEGVIEISAYVVTGDNAVEEVAADAYFYNAADATLHTPEAGTIYTLGGQAVGVVEAGSNDLSGLSKGIYVVVTPAGTLKIAR